MNNFRLILLPSQYIICQLLPDAAVPPWARGDDLLALIRTPDEFTIVCQGIDIPEGVRTESGWRTLKVAGPLEFSMVGVLASLSDTLAKANVSIFVISTFDTDYLLVKESQLQNAIFALESQGHSVEKQ